MVVLDTSAWIEYFLGSKKGAFAKGYVESDREIFTPTICLAEIKLKYAQEKMQKQGEDRLKFIINRSVIVDLSKEIALLGAENKLKHKLYLIDSVIYSTAQVLGKDVLTSDADLRGLPGVLFLN